MKKAIALFFLTCLCALPAYLWAQTIQVTGKVVSQKSGTPLAGASVRIKGTDRGTVTDAQGRFIVQAKHGEVLVISYLGEETQELKVGNDASPMIALVDKTGNLEDVVVVGYGVQKKSVVTGAIASVKASDFANMPVSRVDDVLKGRTSGVIIAQNSGAPGSASTIMVRGVTSINQAANTPLYVVDGNIVDFSGIDYLNPADIESVEVLKDAASTAIYGARGGPGVILITTKKGKAGNSHVTYTGSFATSAPVRKLDLLNATQYATLRNESSLAAGKGIIFSNPQSLGAGTDWQGQVFNNHALTENHELAISGGSEKGTYYTSFGYYDQQGIVAPSISHYKRLTARINTEAKIRPWLTIGENFGYSYIKNQGSLNVNSPFGGPLSSAINLDPVTPVVITDPAVLSTPPYSTQPVVKDGLGRPYGISPYVGQEMTNPVAYIQTQQGNNGWSHNLVGDGYITVGPIKGFKFTSDFHAKQAFWGSRSFTPVYFLSSTANNLTSTNLYEAYNQGLRWNWDNYLSYSLNRGGHNLLVMAGYTSEEQAATDYLGGTFVGLPVSSYGQASTNYSLPQVNELAAGSQGQVTSRSSYIGRLTYNFEERYLLTANFRRDGSSNFGTNNKYGNFPSASVGWVPSNEKFWSRASNYVDRLKIRAGFGVNGNDAIAPFQYESTISGGRNYPYGTGGGISVGYSPNAPANPDLKWERVTQTDIGFDATVYRHFNVTFDWFNKKTTGMLQSIVIPGYSGAAGNPTGNVGDMYSRGVELDLGYNQRVGAVNLSLSGHISHITDKVTSTGTTQFFGGATFQASSYEINRIQAGQPLNEFYGFQTLGIFQTQADVNNYVGKTGMIQPNAKPGDFKFADPTGAGAIVSADRTWLGNPIPTWTYGFTASATYKAFDLTVFMQGVSGNKIYQGYRRLDIPAANYQTIALNRWTGPGTSNTFPRLIDGDPNGNFTNPTAFYLKDGAYLKVKSLRLGYMLPKALTDRAGFQKIYIYVAGDNLLTFTKYNGFDPEVGGGFGVGGAGNANNYGEDNGVYPTARTYTVGLNVGF